MAHRYRFVAPLCTGRVVLDIGGATAHHPVLAAARMRLDGAPEADVVLDLRLADVAGGQATWRLALAETVRQDATLVLAIAGGLTAALRDALAARFRCVTAFVQRPLLGSLIAAAPFAASRVTALADGVAGAAAASPCTIVVCGASPPDLACGLFEADVPLHATSPRIAPPAPPPPPRRVPAHAAALVPRADAVSLVERLMDLDQHAFSLSAENRVLREQLAGARPAIATPSAPGGASGLYPGEMPVSWPLLENPDLPIKDLGNYERRPDDDLIEAARNGERFLGAHALLAEAPDYPAAIAALNAAAPRLALIAMDEIRAPDVSIIIPVYGQLAYTLNCLDGLLGHASRHRAEIIVVDDASPDGSGALLPGILRIRAHLRAANGGFIAACNEGAALARGRFIVMLNNDTRVLPGWLDGLIDSFTLFPAAGLVGSKLLYPDGTLQEAGGIVWRDGNGWNYGRGHDPNRPAYCHARQVDYISGASIALPADLWRDLGGFDRYYAPAYYEDTDLAFRVRACGRQVWLQPLSRVIHYEGRTSGTDTGSGAKAHQIINRGRFFYRWRETLMRYDNDRASVATARERQVVRRAVLLDDTTPTPRQDAGSNYTLLTMRLFLALGYKLSFVPQDNFLYQPGHTTDLHRVGIETAYAPYYLGTDIYLQRHGALLDVVMVSRMQVLEKVIDELRQFAPQAPVLFNTHDLNFLRMRRAAEVAGDGGMMAAADAMRERELALMRQVDCVVTPSEFEGEILSRLLPEVPTRVLPIMSDLEGTQIGFDERRDVCFLGGYRHPPNVDAVKFFLDQIFPLLKREEPGLRFIMAGANPSAELQALADDDIVVTGMVDDLRDVFDRVRVFVCPLRVGAGAKGKVASAMSYGVPIVSTSIGAEGMGLVDGQTVLLADTPAEFAAACLRLYRDPALWASLSEASLDLVRRVASPEEREGIFRDAIDAAVRHKCGFVA